MNPRRLAARLLAHPLTWLALLAVAVGLGVREQGWLAPEVTYDTVSYEWPLELMTFADVLRSVRTFSYPMLLLVYGLFADDYASLPTVHLLIYFTAVALFWLGVRSYSRSRWLAFAAAAPLVAPCVLPWVRQIQPDLVAPAFAVLTMAVLFLLARRPRSVGLWIALTLAALLTYHLRPAYLFVVVLVPMVGLVLALGARRARVVRFTLGLAAACLLPLLSYCGMRWVVVGEFALLNLDGYNLIGIAASFLDQETVDAMPGEHRGLAARILRQRDRRGWVKYTEESDSQDFFRQYGINQWFIAEPIARRILFQQRHRYRKWKGDHKLPVTPLEAFQIERSRYRIGPLEGELAAVLNEQLRDFSHWLIERHPNLYVKWVRDGFLHGLGRLGTCHLLRWLAILTAVSLPVLYVRRRLRPPADTPSRTSPRALCVYGLLVLGAGFFLAKLALVVLVSWPVDRYLFATLLFLPSALGAVLFETWRAITWKVDPPPANSVIDESLRQGRVAM